MGFGGGSWKILLSLAVLVTVAVAVGPPAVTGQGEAENETDREFGDAPDPYPTTRAENGARHVDASRAWLGENVTVEPSPRRFDADDGLEHRSPFALEYTVHNADWQGALYVNVLVDKNGDGDWNDSEEWVVSDREVTVPQNESRQFRDSINSLVSGSPLGFEVDRPSPRTGWLRITLTGEPVEPRVSRFTGHGEFPIGETEDYPPGVPTGPWHDRGPCQTSGLNAQLQGMANNPPNAPIYWHTQQVPVSLHVPGPDDPSSVTHRRNFVPGGANVPPGAHGRASPLNQPAGGSPVTWVTEVLDTDIHPNRGTERVTRRYVITGTWVPPAGMSPGYYCTIQVKQGHAAFYHPPKWWIPPETPENVFPPPPLPPTNPPDDPGVEWGGGGTTSTPSSTTQTAMNLLETLETEYNPAAKEGRLGGATTLLPVRLANQCGVGYVYENPEQRGLATGLTERTAILHGCTDESRQVARLQPITKDARADREVDIEVYTNWETVSDVLRSPNREYAVQTALSTGELRFEPAGVGSRITLGVATTLARVRHRVTSGPYDVAPGKSRTISYRGRKSTLARSPLGYRTVTLADSGSTVAVVDDTGAPEGFTTRGTQRLLRAGGTDGLSANAGVYAISNTTSREDFPLG